MTTHQEALEAARNAVLAAFETNTADWNGLSEDEIKKHTADLIAHSAIEAYLSTLTADTAGLVGRLQKLKVWDDHPSNADLGPLAADTITALTAENAALKAERDVARRHTSNLLARIHRDGGHYETEHGTSKAVEDADEIIARLYADETRIEALVDRAGEALEPIGSIAGAVFRVEDGREMNASKADDAAVWGFDEAELAYESIARAFNSLEALDDDNLTAALAKLTEAELPIAAEENRPVDWVDVTGWGVFKGHAIPVEVARFIAEKINLYADHRAALAQEKEGGR